MFHVSRILKSMVNDGISRKYISKILGLFLSEKNSQIFYEIPRDFHLPVTVAVVVLPAVPAGPHVDVAQAAPPLINTAHDGAHCGVSRAVHRPPVVRRAPAGAGQ